MVKKPFIGQMDRKIQVVNPVSGRDAAGGITSTDQTVCEVWAAMEDVSGDEAVDGKEMHKVRRNYTIRYQTEVAAGKDFVIVDGATRYRIRHVSETGRRSHLTINAELYE